MPGQSHAGDGGHESRRRSGSRRALDAIVRLTRLFGAGLAVGIVGIVGGGCADAPSSVAWLGEAPHLVLHGVNEGVPTDAEVVEQELLDMAFFHCERTYEVPVVAGVEDPSRARLVTTKVSFFFLSPDERPRTFAIELGQHDLQADAPGTTVTVVPRREGEVLAADEVLFEMSIADFLLDEKYLHAAAKFGEVTLHQFTGTPPAGSRIIPSGEGAVGFTFDVVFHPEGYFRGSITAPCTVTRVVPVVTP